MKDRLEILSIGVSHHTAPIAVRERVAVASERLEEALHELCARPGIAEAMIVSTCNRLEIYAAVRGEEGPASARAFLREREPGIDRHLYENRGLSAVRHLFRVCASLDSMVVGEPQILGQVKDAWQAARERRTLRTPLDRLFQQSFSVAKRVRTDTRIGAHPVSVAFAAVRLARQVFSELDRATVLLVGAGDTIELAARHLVEAKARRLLVANRTLEHAQALASQHGGYALPLTELPRHLPEADIVFSATAARDPVIRREMVDAALKARRHRPMFMLDLAVPRDIEASVGELSDVYLYTVDDLEQVIEENRASRREAAAQAEAIIDLQVAHFMAWWRAQGRQDVLRGLRSRGEAIREEALQRAREQLAAGKPAEEVLGLLAHQLTNKLLHGPSSALRQAALDGDLDLLRAAERLYLDGESGEP